MFPPLQSISLKDSTSTEIYTLSLHDALPILHGLVGDAADDLADHGVGRALVDGDPGPHDAREAGGVEALQHRVLLEVARSEEHTSELQSQSNLVCRLLLEKKKTKQRDQHIR